MKISIVLIWALRLLAAAILWYPGSQVVWRLQPLPLRAYRVRLQ